MIKNIIFDMGNVLLHYNPEIPLDAYCVTEEEKEVVRKELFQGPEWEMGDLGEISDRDRYDLIKGRVPEKYHDALRKCAYGWEICMTPVEGAVEFCEEMKEKGYGLYVLSNASDLFEEYFPRFSRADIFEKIMVSYQVHLTKPDVRIYKRLLETCHLNPAECLFVDDRLDNVEGARKAGMNAVQFLGDFGVVRNCL